jgi:hypothetical protein
MPGPVSDSYDPEFGTADNADSVRRAIRAVIHKVNGDLNDEPRKNILEVVNGRGGKTGAYYFCERELRIIRFCLHRAEDSI